MQSQIAFIALKMYIIIKSIYLIYFVQLIDAQLTSFNKNSNQDIRTNAFDNNVHLNYDRYDTNTHREQNHFQNSGIETSLTRNNFEQNSTPYFERTQFKQQTTSQPERKVGRQGLKTESSTRSNIRREDKTSNNRRESYVPSNSESENSSNSKNSFLKNNDYNSEQISSTRNSEFQYTRGIVSTKVPKHARNKSEKSKSQIDRNFGTSTSRPTIAPNFENTLNYNYERRIESTSSTRKYQIKTTKSSFKNERLDKKAVKNPARYSTNLLTERPAKYNRNRDSNFKPTKQMKNPTNTSAKKIVQKRISQRKYEEYMLKLFGDDDSEEGNMILSTRHLDGREVVDPGEYPHMVAVGFMTTNNTIDWKCGGSLISDYFVVTAAHCCDFSGQKPSHIKVGGINLKVKERNTESQKIVIDKIFKHPLYYDASYYNDIALLKLSVAAVFTNFVRPIRLWDKSLIPYDTVYAMGYGATAFGKSKTNVLTDLNLTIVENHECNERLPKIPETNVGIIESQMCAIDKIGNRDTCQGDSGGPLQLNLLGKNRLRYHLVGITSFGVLCGGDHPSVYTRISAFIDWIEETVWAEY